MPSPSLWPCASVVGSPLCPLPGNLIKHNTRRHTGIEGLHLRRVRDSYSLIGFRQQIP